MGFVGSKVASRRSLPLGLAAGLAAALCSCGVVTDPSTPCESQDLGEAEPGAMVSRRHAPVLAVTAAPTPFVLAYLCPESSEEGCTLRKIELEDLAPGNQIMLTSSGRYVVAIDRELLRVRWYELTHDEPGIARSGGFPIGDPTAPVRLVASLRDSDWLVVRDAEERLRRYLPGHSQAAALAPGLDGASLVAVGEDHVVARQRLDDDNEVLWLVPVDESLPYVERGPIRMGEFRNLGRVAFSPRDERILVTTGEGDEAYTSVFSVPDGWVDRFSGSLADARQRQETLPGLQSFSPDGSHVAYRTASGAVALRDLELGSSCLVRSSSAGDHRLAAFSAQGVLFMESSTGPGRNAVTAWDPRDRRLWALASRDEGYRLAFLPSRDTDAADGPWAIGVRNGSHAALQEQADPEHLELDASMFLARDAEQIWALQMDVTNTGRQHLALRTVAPRFDLTTRSYEFSTQLGGGDAGFELELESRELVCMSTGTPGVWDYRCGRAGSATFFSSKTAPPSESDQTSKNTRDDEVPDFPGNGLSCGANGVSLSAAGENCEYMVEDEGCCYPTIQDACVALGCGDVQCIEVDANGQRAVECGQPGGFPG